MLKKMKLAPKLALVIGSMLTLILVALIAVAVLLSKSAIETSTYGELSALSKANGRQIQEVFDAADSTAQNMQNYLEKAYRTAASDPAQNTLPTDPETIAMCRSVIYDKVLTSLNYDVEQFISETARNTAINNEDVQGVGVMFEPYAFQTDMRDYAFYVDESNAEGTIEPFGAFESYSKEAYYQEAAAARKAVVTDPYEYDGVSMVSYALPILSDGQLQGVVMADIDVSSFSKVDATNESYPSMYATIYTGEGLIIYDSEDPADMGKSVADYTPKADELEAIRAGFSGTEAFQIETTREDGRKVTRFFSPIDVGEETWWALTAVDSKDVTAAVRSTVLWMVVVSAVALVVILLAVIFLLKGMLRPMQPIVQAAESISNGNLDVSLSVTSQDEIGILAQSFRKMAENLRRIVGDVDHLLGGMAGGDFGVKTKAEESYVGDFHGILMSMRSLNRTLSDTLSQINRAADQVAAGSDQVSSGAQALSQGATEQASSTEELAATISEISEQVSRNAENARSADDQAVETARELESGKAQMEKMTVAMGHIDETSQEIGKIIKTIEDIAFQTNILALNAAVEAARAGAAGKGFAVVADEVRNLASKSSEASKNTAALIEASLSAVKEGTSMAQQTADSMERVVVSSGRSAQLVRDIATASQEQAASIAQVTQGIDQISSVVQTNSATAEESAAASEELSSQAQMLKMLVGRFKLRDGGGAAAVQPAPVEEQPAEQQPAGEYDSAPVGAGGKY